jgi:hypothetical protein
VDRTTEKLRLEKIAAGLLARADLTCRIVAPHEQMSSLTIEGRQALEHDLKKLNPGRVMHHFPWDASGRLALKTAVLLNHYPTTKAVGKGRDLCLAAVGPDRRGDAQEIRIDLIDLILVNQTHRWENSRWLWTDEAVPNSELLGVEATADTPENARAVESLRLLDEGRIEEALSLHHVTLSDDVHKLLGGQRIKAYDSHPDETWTNLLVDTLRQSAPWLLAGAVENEVKRLAQKKGRRSLPNLKLVIFPGQVRARKTSLMLTGGDGGKSRLVIEATGSNARLPDRAWKRPLAVDFLRYDVVFPTALQR